MTVWVEGRGIQTENVLWLWILYHVTRSLTHHTLVHTHTALSDPYLSLSASMNGLAGPLHGLANQEVRAEEYAERGKRKEE